MRLDGEVHSLKAAAAVSAERHDAAVAQLEKRLQRAQEAVQAKQDEVRNSLLPSPSPLLSHVLYCFCSTVVVAFYLNLLLL